jgi:alcohol dehydrogenase
MRAVVFEGHGEVSGLQWREDWPEPHVGSGEVKIRVEASSFNGFDPMILRGIPGIKTPFPMIPGGDIAGTVVEVGVAVPAGNWSVGDRVLIQPLMPGHGLMGETLRGGFCEFVCVPPGNLIKIPDNVSFVDAAALPIAYGTAHRLLITRAKVTAGEKVLILGATGGVGTCCVQLAKLAGAEVAACTSSEAKGEKLRALGADHIINTAKEDFLEASIRLFGKPKVFSPGGGADIVVNYIGGKTWAQALRATKHSGRVLTCGATDGFDPPTDIRYIWSLELNILGSNVWTIDDLKALLDHVSKGALKPAIHSVRKMADVKISMQELIDRKVFGKAVLTP